ncbi:hypothetical protein B0A52_02663 [Exophiala mesophila]|uniref:TLC domain-containing protein n=1 Tax=Exophiala mesophila TaxID=212818 RepID=A0A438NDA2_EXOME|nr:hypothetical protein B0A52_02663 [Exophiala mesophila]
MRDPFPPPPQWLFDLCKPYAEALNLVSLPYHIHEVLFAFILYQSTQSIFSPILSNIFFPSIYQKLNRRTRVNWDVHVVSLLQSTLINGLALWVMWSDQERYDMQHSAIERIYGYTGASGMIQAFATGYFVWDIVVSTRYVRIFGPGIWAHAVTALAVFSLGFTPFVNYYGPVFILYELSSPFLNIHWFCDKLNMTGSNLQWYNGMLLLGMFFCCRLLWGTYQSLRVYQDVWQTLHLDTSAPVYREVHGSAKMSIFAPRNGELCLGDTECLLNQSEVMKFAGGHTQAVPVWMAAVYLTCNLVLNSLNFYWFGKMIETVRKRFDGKPAGADVKKTIDRRDSLVEELASELDRDEISGPKTPFEERSDVLAMSTGVSVQDESAKKR